MVAKFCAIPTPFRDHLFGVKSLTRGLSFLGFVVRRIGKQRKYETRYPGERPVDHDLRSEEYGSGGWTDEQQQIWTVIVKDSR